MNRRTFLKATAGLPVAVWGLSGLGRAQPADPAQPTTPAQAPAPAAAPATTPHKEFAPRPGSWRTFEITTRVEVAKPGGVTRLWLPLPAVTADFQATLDNHWTGNARKMGERAAGAGAARMLYAEFVEG